MGSVLRMKIWENTDFDEIIKKAEKKEIYSVCADINARKSYDQIDWKKPGLLVFGSEAHGLSEKERNIISGGLIIPMENNVESLNLAVSVGIILFEAKRQFNLFKQ
jgi:tRNA G18 (ribose-2'-O)-methylase SpoU